MRLKLIACEIFYREICAVVARSVNQVDVEFLPKGLHDIGQRGMNDRLAQSLEAVDEDRYDAILFGYGLCSNGLVGLAARSIPLVLPRAHDCITLFFGDKERYQDYFEANPGVYFKTTGWIERGDQLDQLTSQSVQHNTGMATSYEELVEKYGEDNAQYLYEQLCDTTRNYRQITFIEMGIEPDEQFEKEAERIAAKNHWQYEKVRGDLRLLTRLVDGPWNDDDFLTVQPGKRIAASYDGRVVVAEPPT